MRTLFRSYLIWVLLPVAMTSLAAYLFSTRAPEDLSQASLERMGGMATLLFRVEMGERAGEMSETAPLLERPDSTSPILRAALRGDTVAALGLAGPDLVLSVALAVPGDGEVMELKAITQPFEPRSLTRFHGSSGHPVALFFRGALVAAEPPGFVPSLLQATSSGALHPSRPEEQLLLPLAQMGAGPSPVQLLVESVPGRHDPGLGWHFPAALALVPGLLALGLATLLHRRGKRGSGKAWILTLLAPAAVPWLVLWALLHTVRAQVDTLAEVALNRDLTQSIAMINEGTLDTALEGLPPETGFEIVQRGQGSSVTTTLDDETLLQLALDEPLPPQESPAQGTIESGGTVWAYVTSRVGPDKSVLLLSRQDPGSQGGVQLLLMGLATLSAFAFVASSRARRVVG